MLEYDFCQVLFGFNYLFVAINKMINIYIVAVRVNDGPRSLSAINIVVVAFPYGRLVKRMPEHLIDTLYGNKICPVEPNR